MISDDVKAQLREIVSRYPVARSGMLPCLHLVQDVEGYVTPEGIAAVAEAVGAKVDEVESVVTFYSMYHQKPIGKHVIKVCTSISCYLMGCDDVLAHLEKRLGISRGQTTPDGRYTLQGVECLAACGLAPALQVNNEFVENVTPQVADALLDRLEHGKGVEDMGGQWEFAGKAAGASEDAANAGAQRKRA
jgi:NADH-quinone oxidoreductase E subunit